jgi:hypothetical protein
MQFVHVQLSKYPQKKWPGSSGTGAGIPPWNFDGIMVRPGIAGRWDPTWDLVTVESQVNWDPTVSSHRDKTAVTFSMGLPSPQEITHLHYVIENPCNHDRIQLCDILLKHLGIGPIKISRGVAGMLTLKLVCRLCTIPLLSIFKMFISQQSQGRSGWDQHQNVENIVLFI